LGHPTQQAQVLTLVFGVQLAEVSVHADVHGLPSEQPAKSDMGRAPPWTRLVSDGLRTFKVSLLSTNFFIAMFSLDNVSRHRLDACALRLVSLCAVLSQTSGMTALES
jgi:hypothetical protein